MNNIYIIADLNEAIAKTEVIQYYNNDTNNPIELTLTIPNLPEIQISEFKIKKGSQIITSKILEKEKAKEKYNDAISSGNTGIILNYTTSNQEYEITIGQILPNENVEVHTFFLQIISSEDMSYLYQLITNYPRFNVHKNKLENKEIELKINLNAFSKITRLKIEEKDKNYLLSKQYNNEYDNCKLYFKFPISENKIFKILFRTEKIEEPVIYSQYDESKNETSFVFNYMYNLIDPKLIEKNNTPDENSSISYYDKYQKNIVNENQALFIFLVDTSGSMSGSPIEKVKETLIIFLKSLPINSYFQLITFNSTFSLINQEPLNYTNENISNLINVISNLFAQGGTDCCSPLEYITNNYLNLYEKFKVMKNVIILTDGETEKSEECFQIIQKNNSKFKFHSIGIGSVNSNYIEQVGKIGKGSSNYVNNNSQIVSITINVLNRCLRSYIIDANIKFLNTNPLFEYQSQKNLYQDEILNYLFITSGENFDSLSFSLSAFYNNKNFTNNIKVDINNIKKIGNGNELSKIIIGNILNNQNIFDENSEIQLSKKYQVLSKNTSLYGEINNNNNQIEKLIPIHIIKTCDNFLNNNMRLFGCGYSLNKVSGFFSGGNNNLFMNQNNSNNNSNLFMNQNNSNINSNLFMNENSSNNNRMLFGSVDNRSFSSALKSNQSLIIGSESLFNSVLILQNNIEGSWSENDTTNIIKNHFHKEFLLIKSNLNQNNIFQEEVIYTFLVMYYLNKYHKDKIQGLFLMIQKAQKYLNKCNLTYQSIESFI